MREVVKSVCFSIKASTELGRSLNVNAGHKASSGDSPLNAEELVRCNAVTGEGSFCRGKLSFLFFEVHVAHLTLILRIQSFECKKLLLDIAAF